MRPDAVEESVRMKTGKRETAWAMLGYVAGLGVAAVWLESVQAMQLVELFVVPVIVFAAGALGVDEYSKNILGRHRGGDK